MLAALTPIGTDYVASTQPAIDALRVGDFGAFLAAQPSMGPLSMWLRWPAAVAADAFGGGDLLVYRLGALACLLVLAAVVVALARMADRRGEIPRGDVLVLVAVLTLNPVTLRALELGHPEEPLGAALCLAAVLLAAGDRTLASGLTLGLAIATKQWALFAVLPVLLAAPPTRAAATRILLPAGAVTLAAYLPMLLGDPHAFAAALSRPVAGLGEMRPANLWHLLAVEGHLTSVGAGETIDVQRVPIWLQAFAHPGIAAVAFAVPVAFWRAGRARATLGQALGLLALVFLLRCWLDPWNHSYYHLPMLLALAAYEVLALRRAPIVTFASSALLWIVFARMAEPGLGPAIDLFYLPWVAAITLWLVAGVSREPRAATIRAWSHTQSPDASQQRSPIAG